MTSLRRDNTKPKSGQQTILQGEYTKDRAQSSRIVFYIGVFNFLWEM